MFDQVATNAIRSETLTTRTLDAAVVNAVCNHPAVHPGLSLGLDAIDVTDLIADTRNIAFIGEFGGAVFHRSAPDIYAAHDFFLPEGRGRWALAASREMLTTMFADYGARMIWAETPANNMPCRMFNRWLGFKSLGASRVALYPGAEPQDIETFVMERG